MKNTNNWSIGRIEEELSDLREAIRHAYSRVLAQHPCNCRGDLWINIPSYEAQACGLSSLEIPSIVSVFEDGDGIIWLEQQGCEPKEFDEWNTEDLIGILKDL